MKVPSIFTSKRFWVGFGTLVAIIATAFYPSVAEYENELVQVVAIVCEGIVGMFLMGVYTAQDMAQMSYTPLRILANSTKTKADDELLDLVITECKQFI